MKMMVTVQVHHLQLEDLEIRGRVETMETTLLISARIQRSILRK